MEYNNNETRKQIIQLLESVENEETLRVIQIFILSLGIHNAG